MLRDMLIGTFETGDWFIGVLFWVLGFAFAVGVFIFVLMIIDEYRWSKTAAFTYECNLVNSEYAESTLQTNAVPVVGSNGNVGVGVVSSGRGEVYSTVWDCGKYGRLVSKNDEVFRFAKEKSTLFLKEKEGGVRITGIVK